MHRKRGREVTQDPPGSPPPQADDNVTVSQSGIRATMSTVVMLKEPPELP